jgi:2-polyprenyl-3-methyl-5-hydroxy-6-metoxy-1,4-benzoquinol methylase
MSKAARTTIEERELDFVRFADAWKSSFKPITIWDDMFADGRWDYLDSIGEAPRYAVIAGYIHRRLGKSRVLDVGCGAGVLFNYFDQSRVRYTGTDVSSAAIDQARRRFPDVDFTSCDIADFKPAGGETFDAIVFNEVLPQVEDPFGSLARYKQYLKPGGVLVVSTYQNTNPTSNSAVFSALLEQCISEGCFKALAQCEVSTSEKGLKWRIDVVAGDDQPNDGF